MEFETYTSLGFKKLDEETFQKVVTDSEMLIGILIRNYYDLHDINEDLNSNDNFLKFRATQYEKAICIQCEYADDIGGSSLVEQQQSNLSDVTIGRTHLSRSNSPANTATFSNSGVYLPAYQLLGSTGLLYRGVDSH